MSKDIRDQINKIINFQEEINKDYSKILKVIDGIKIRLIDADHFSKTYPVWNIYLGSHHWGKESSHIPKDEIWISNKIKEENLDKIIQHELIERSIMRSLQKYKNMTPEESWNIAHFFVKSIGF